MERQSRENEKDSNVSIHPVAMATGVIFAFIAAVATFFIGRETAPQRNIYHGPNERAFEPNDPMCSICREEILVTQETYLRCGHVFHTTCIQEWNKCRLSCPNCNIRI